MTYGLQIRDFRFSTSVVPKFLQSEAPCGRTKALILGNTLPRALQ